MAALAPELIVLTEEALTAGEAATVAVEGTEAAAAVGESAEAAGAVGESAEAAEAAEATEATSLDKIKMAAANPIVQGGLFTAGATGVGTLLNRVGSWFSGSSTHFSAQQIDQSNKTGLMMLALAGVGYFLFKRMA